jgi:hypothetical protein
LLSSSSWLHRVKRVSSFQLLLSWRRVCAKIDSKAEVNFE